MGLSSKAGVRNFWVDQDGGYKKIKQLQKDWGSEF